MGHETLLPIRSSGQLPKRERWLSLINYLGGNYI